MSAVYVVIVTNMLSEVEVCEVYAGVQSALGRAFHLASARAANSNFVNASPEEERLEDGTIRWSLLETNKVFVGVYFKNVEVSLNSRNTRSDAVPLSNPLISPPNTLDYNHLKNLMFTDGYQEPAKVADLPSIVDGYQASLPPATPLQSLDDDSLPAGWFYHSNRPAIMKDLKEDPESIKDPRVELSEDEKWALAIARLNKRKKFLQNNNSFTHVIDSSLSELKARTSAGEIIRDKELAFLSFYRDEMINLFDV